MIIKELFKSNVFLEEENLKVQKELFSIKERLQKETVVNNYV